MKKRILLVITVISLIIAMTAPNATTSSARSSPGTLLRNIAFPLSGESVPNASLKSPRTMSMLSPMHGLTSPGLLISNSLPDETQTEQRSPRRMVPQESHHAAGTFPLATFLWDNAMHRREYAPRRISNRTGRDIRFYL